LYLDNENNDLKEELNRVKSEYKNLYESNYVFSKEKKGILDMISRVS
jgi:hypothetical protein